ncbi:metallophosphoesterase [Embleya sp. NPDC020630]|uniref:metallophosphoesterase n=1 Tax=Embleya sp. NPDC020630 TaxID=3363979 RepID=UPI00379068A8
MRYTLDGTTPTRDSRVYSPGRPLWIDKDTNVTAVAFHGNRASVPVSYGYLIKTAEKPLARMVVMSDVHVGGHAANDKKYESFFDTIGSVFPKPDAILVNGDMINDNGDGKGPDHKIVSEIFQANLARKGMTDTQVLVSTGNHDDSLAAIRAGYPKAWFPDSGGGYYDSVVGGLHVLTINSETYNSDTAQRAWLKQRLAAITADRAYAGKPVLVQGHRPATDTVMDGRQASNPRLTKLHVHRGRAQHRGAAVHHTSAAVRGARRQGRHGRTDRPGHGRPDGAPLQRRHHRHGDGEVARLVQGLVGLLLHAPPEHPRHPRTGHGRERAVRGPSRGRGRIRQRLPGGVAYVRQVTGAGPRATSRSRPRPVPPPGRVPRRRRPRPGLGGGRCGFMGPSRPG